jgi:hypothetical protein
MRHPVQPLFRPVHAVLLLAVLALSGCGDTGPDEIIPGVDCTTSTAVNLDPGESVILDATLNAGCIQLPAATAGGATHLVVAYAGAGTETPNGISGAFSFSSEALASATPPAPAGPAWQADPASEFHRMLRRRESEMTLTVSRPLPGPLMHRPPPVLGTQDTFKVCGDTDCNPNTFVNVAATARYVGPRGAIYLDNTVPPNGLTQEDIDSLGSLFDGASPNIYAIDTTAFGRESDQDGNSVVIILLTNAVNALSGNCAGGSIILGYFFGLDLLTDPNSNRGEIFYGLVPNPAGGNCAVSRNQVFQLLPPVLIHELQHMISFNQHVLVRSGSAEQTWLNEGLSHFAEELGGRVLPDSRCFNGDCVQQFIGIGNLLNAFDYLQNPGLHFLVSPASSFGTLEERGASWLFLRWLADHEAQDTLLGTDLTRDLVETSQVGAPNIVAATGQPFAQLVGQWQMANYAEGLSGFTDLTGRLRYRTFDLLAALGPPYPLIPPVSTTGGFTTSGTLRAGAGRHVIFDQAADAPPIVLQLKGDSRFTTLVPRIAVVRIQ